MGYLDGFGVIIKKWFGVNTDSGARVTLEYPEQVRPKPERFHGRHVLNRYEDGMEKCIGCELCAGVCPAKCIYVRGRDNDPDDPTSPGERFGYVYEINYLRCIHCDLCVEACPTEAITESKLFEFSFTNRDDAIYTKNELVVGDDGRPQQLPWENWDGGFDPAQDTSGWMRATAPQGDQNFKGLIAWAGELGYGVRPPERAKILEETGPVPAVAHGHHDDAGDHVALEPDDGAGHDAVDPQTIDVPDLQHAAIFDAGDVPVVADDTYEVAAEYDAAGLIGEQEAFEAAARFDAGTSSATPDAPKVDPVADQSAAFDSAAHFDADDASAGFVEDETKPAWFSGDATAVDDEFADAARFDAPRLDPKRKGSTKRSAETERATEPEPELEVEVAEPDAATEPDTATEPDAAAEPDTATEVAAVPDAAAEPDTATEAAAATDAAAVEDRSHDTATDSPTGDESDPGVDQTDEGPEPTDGPSAAPAEEPLSRQAGHFDAPEAPEPEKKKRRFRR